jgi:hypothetical protein
VESARASGAFFCTAKDRERTGSIALEVSALTAVLVIAWLVLPSVFLPVLSLTSLAAAAGFGLYVRLRGTRRPMGGLSSRDLAGGLAFLGFAAGMLSKPDQILQLFGPVAMIN